MVSDEGNVSALKSQQRAFPPARSDMSMMRIAIAGTNGLACAIARCIQEDTAHQVVLLSRTAQPQITAKGYQVIVVDYGNFQTIAFALRGVDTIISTVTGPSQFQLITVAVTVGVRRFAAAEFEGLPQLRPQNDPLDRYRSQAWRLLTSQNIQSTAFICGILFERFQPGGLKRSRIGMSSAFSGEGEYMIDCRNMRAKVPVYDVNNNPNVAICMTAVQDVARFVTRAIDIPDWPTELRMCGQRVALKDLVAIIQHLKQRTFDDLQLHSPYSLQSELQVATAQRNQARITQLQTLIATAGGRYDFTLPDLNRSLNHRFPDVQPIPFQDWFVRVWEI